MIKKYYYLYCVHPGFFLKRREDYFLLLKRVCQKRTKKGHLKKYETHFRRVAYN